MDPKALVFPIDIKCDLSCICVPSFSLHNSPKILLFKVCLSISSEEHLSFFKMMGLVTGVISLIAIMITSRLELFLSFFPLTPVSVVVLRVNYSDEYLQLL